MRCVEGMKVRDNWVDGNQDRKGDDKDHWEGDKDKVCVNHRQKVFPLFHRLVYICKRETKKNQ